jgi:hypothetical protein
MNRPIDKQMFVAKLHDFIMQHNTEIGMQHGLTDDQVISILENHKKDNMILCSHIYDFLRLEGYIDG